MSEDIKKSEEVEVDETFIPSSEDLKPISVNDEIKEFNKSVLGKLDAPLVVHKQGDASYEDVTDNYEMNETHSGESKPTLKRHRFRKEKKKSKAPIVILFIIVIGIAVLAGLYATGNLTFGEKETTTVPTTEPTTIDLVAKYQGTIVVKETYIFVNGEEVNGIEGLQNAIKYDDPSPTAYEIIVDNEESDFFNLEVLALLENMGFFDDTSIVTHLADTGLIAEAEKATEMAQSTSSVEDTSKEPTT